MAYRDEREALRQRAAAAEGEAASLRAEAERARHLEKKVGQLQRELDRHRPRTTPRRRGPRLWVMASLMLAGAGSGAAWWVHHVRARSPAATEPAPARGKIIAYVTREAIKRQPKIDLSRPPVVLGSSMVGLWGRCEGARGLGLRAIDLATGREAWSQCETMLPNEQNQAHALANGAEFAVWSNRSFAVFDGQSGRPLLGQSTPSAIIGVCVDGEQTYNAELEDGRFWQADLRQRKFKTVDALASGCRPEAPRDAWTSANEDRAQRVVDAASLPDGRLPNLEIGEGDEAARHVDVTRAGPVPGGTIALGVHGGRPAIAFIEATTAKWALDLPIPEGVTADGTTPAAAIADERAVFVAYQPARDSGLRIAALALSSGALVWSAPVGRPEWTLHAVNGLALTPTGVLVREPWHLYGLLRSTGAPGLDLP